MTQKTRILVAVAVLVVLVAVVLGVDALRRVSSPVPVVEGESTLPPGSVPVYLDGRLVGGFSPTDLEQLEKMSFTDAEEGKTQEGWPLRDVLLLHVDRDKLQANSLITVSSSSRNKSAQLTWVEVNEPTNMVLFDLSGRGTLKLVSVLERLDTRDEWVQDVDSIEIVSP
ncbi:MAG: hypothetical protein SVX38_05925 [Chloroflexota bacterium]|nr:hypothetical protein [Chloroflexota bacterium]